MKLPAFFWFEISSFIISIVAIKRIKGTSFVYFIPFLFITSLTEILGIYFKFVLHRNNALIYNLYLFVEISFFLFLFRKNSESSKLRNFAKWSIVIFSPFYIINLLFFQKLNLYNSYSAILGAFLIIIAACAFFYYCIQDINETNIASPFVNPMFWIAVGCLFYYAGTFFYFALYENLLVLKSDANDFLFSTINLNLIIVLNLCLIYGISIKR
jgi:hypothetical protein